MINDAPLHNIWARASDIPCLVSMVNTAVQHDWRSLGIKASLYDMCTDPTWTDPTGNDYAFAKKAVRKTFIHKCHSTIGYRGVALDSTALESHIRKWRHISVNISQDPQVIKTEAWCLGDPYVKLIYLDDRMKGNPVAMALWILVHLRYPLVEVYDYFEIATHGGIKGGNECEPRSTPTLFKRNCSSVLLDDLATDLILVSTDKIMMLQFIAGLTFQVQCGERYYSDIQPVPVFSATQLIDCCIDLVMNYKNSLKLCLNDYLSPRMSGGMNWGEIEQIVSILTVRFCPREEFKVTTENNYTLRTCWLSSEIARSYFTLGAEEAISAVVILPNKGHNATVTAFDQVPSPKNKASSAPILGIGDWTNIAEIAIILGLGEYVAFNREDSATIERMMNSSSRDKILRARPLRAIIEEWKEATALTDDMVNIIKLPRVQDMWDFFTLGEHSWMGLESLCKHLIGGNTLRWRWQILHYHSITVTHTGMRLPPTHRGSVISDGKMAIESLAMIVDKSPQSWRFQKACVQDEEDHPEIDKSMYKIDAIAARKLITTAASSDFTERKLWYCLYECTSRLRLMRSSGYENRYRNGNETNHTWGYGIKSIFRDFESNAMYRTVLPADILEKIKRMTTFWPTKEKIIEGVRELYPSALDMYCSLLKLANKNKLSCVLSEDFIELKSLLKILQQNPNAFDDKENLKRILLILNYTILLENEDHLFVELNKFVEQQIDQLKGIEEISIFLQIVYQILKSLSEKRIEAERLECIVNKIIIYLKSSSNLVFHRCAICVKTFVVDNLNKNILNKIWENIEYDNYLPENCLYIISLLIREYLRLTSVVSRSKFWMLLYDAGKCGEHQMRKHMLFCLKNIIEYLSTTDTKLALNIENYFEWNIDKSIDYITSWTSFLTILECLEEKQSHLIMPSLTMLPQIKINLKWINLLISEILTHTNSLVLNWILKFILEKVNVNDFDDKTLLNFQKALNTTFLYKENNNFPEKLSKFFNRELKRFVETFREVDWKSVPLHNCLKSFQIVKDHSAWCTMEIETYLNIATKIRKVQNKQLRFCTRLIFYELFIFHKKGLFLNEYLALIQTLFNKTEKIFQSEKKFLSCLFNDVLKNSEEIIVTIEGLHMLLKIDCSINSSKKVVESFLNSGQNLVEALTLDKLSKEHFVLIKKHIEDEMINKNSVLQNIIKYIFVMKYEKNIDSFITDEIIIFFEKMITNNEKIDIEPNIYLWNFNKLKGSFVDNFAAFLTRNKKFSELLSLSIEILDAGGCKSLKTIVKALSIYSASDIPCKLLERIIFELETNIRKQGFYIYKKTCGYFIESCLRLNLSLHHTYINKFLEIDCCHPGLANVVYSSLVSMFIYNKDFLLSTHGIELLYWGIIFGEPLHGDEKYEFDYCEFNNINLETFDNKSQVRLNALLALREICKNIPNEDKNFYLNKFIEKLICDSIDLNKKRKRYYDNSKQHRIKLRLVQALAFILGMHKVWDDRFLLSHFEETNQLNVTYIMELIIAETITKNYLENLLNEKNQYQGSSLISLFTIIYIFCRRTKDKDFSMQAINKIMPWTMGQQFNTRVSAQITVYCLIRDFKLDGYFQYLSSCIEESLKQGNKGLNYKRLNCDFRYNYLDYTNLLDPRNIFYYIPKMTGMASDEQINIKSLVNIIGHTTESDMCKADHSCILGKLEVSEETIQIDVVTNNVQKKINPLKLDSKHGLMSYVDGISLKEQFSEMIVIASYITRLPNLGGIARTCEVLGIKNLVIDSLRHLDSQEFKSLSMTAEKWLNIKEVKQSKLFEYLIEKKTEGYNIVGAEQTAKSISFHDFMFPKKCLLLLGHEKEGIPANIISMLDFAVEIPQYGVVRSLNVHVTGSIFMWEYCKQHIISKKE